jgi:hypothetical protein
MAKEKNVFISHHSADDEHIQKFKELLSKKGYTIKNSSIDSSKPNRLVNKEAIDRLLRLRINWAGTFICLIGSDTHSREWVNREIEIAKEKGKKIVGVYVYGEKDATLPPNLEKYADYITAWNSDKIIDAIEGREIENTNPDGSPRQSSNNLVYVSC